MDVFEVMETARAIRYLKPDSIDPEIVDKLIWAATRAPSPGNSQGWDFVVVDDRVKLARLAEALQPLANSVKSRPMPDRTTRLMMTGAANLARTFANAPIVIFVCGAVVYPPNDPQERFVWSATYLAAQNIILAARALGLGATFTTFHNIIEDVVRETLAIPDEVRIAATIPIGWPDRPHGPVQRKPISEVIHRNGW